MKTLILSVGAALTLATSAMAGELPFGPPSEPTVWGHQPYYGSTASNSSPSIPSNIATTGLVRKDGRWVRVDRQPDGRDPAGAHRGR